MQTLGHAMWPAQPVNFTLGENYYGMKTALNCQSWKTAWGSASARVVCVMGNQTGNGGVGLIALNCTYWASGPCSTNYGISALGETGYFGPPQNVPSAWLSLPDGGLSNLCAAFTTAGVDPNAPNGYIAPRLAKLASDHNYFSQFGLPLVGYEGGPNLQSSNGAYASLYTNFHNSPCMETVYTAFLNQWKSTGYLQMMNQYNDARTPSVKLGLWGALDEIWQATSPTYDALINFISNNACWWSGCVNPTALTVNVTGGGTVSSNPAGVSCSSTCNGTFNVGQVTLTATPANGWAFAGWTGACSGTGGCTVTMNAAQSVSATFTQYGLSVTATGNGTVTSSPSGISCGATCTAEYPGGSQVTLSATPAPGWTFGGWGGACSGTGSCVVPMNAGESVTATFSQISYNLSVGIIGNGTVTSSPAGISCPSACNTGFPIGTQVTLTAAPAGGSSFGGWSGACNGAGSCVITMGSAASASATFYSASAAPPASRTWVSAAVGSDANPCTRTAPCLTFAAALAQTMPGGEIDALDQGNFGPVTITNAINISGIDVSAAGTSAPNVPGTSGVTVAAGASDVINLRGLIFDGFNQTATSGVVFTSGGQLHIEDCVLQNFDGAGITFFPGTGAATVAQLMVQDTSTLSNAIGIWIIPTSGTAANAALNRIHADKNSIDGVRADATDGSGGINVSLSDSTASLNAGSGVNAISGPGNATVSIIRTSVTSNGASGIQANQSAGGTASVTMGSSMVSGNASAAQLVGGGTLLSYMNNRVSGNASNSLLAGNGTLE